MKEPRSFTALILAGSRRGGDDPVAKAAGVAHKSLVEIGGRPMLMRVLDAVIAAPSVAKVILAVESRSIVEALPGLAQSIAAHSLSVVETANSPAATVLAVLRTPPPPYPLLVTTSDHALLSPDMIEAFCAGLPADVDVAAALCTRSSIERAYPGARRTYIRLGGEGYSGCNLFAMLNERAANAVSFWLRMEGHRKTPWKYAAEIGPGPLARYFFGHLTLEGAFAELSRRIGAHGAPVVMPMAEAAIDVDTPADLVQVRQILARATA